MDNPSVANGGATLLPGSAAAVSIQWAQAKGMAVSDEVRHKLAVPWGGTDINPTDIRIWEGVPAPGEEMKDVPLEFLFAGAPAMDDGPFGELFQAAVDELLRQDRRAQFRAQLHRRQRNADLRRRGSHASALEGGDEVEESWRSYLHRPMEETSFKVHSMCDIGGRTRRVLCCRTLVSAHVAESLGRAAFPHLFDAGVVAAEAETSLTGKQFLVCFYISVSFVGFVLLLWIYLFASAMSRRM
mmetsp:Transcript_79754/g.221993  ORF Transcript_79754/g.221993 Transcript_79754/m.221993 type:complete len:242 (+) Transcript_79754:46-771(+)